MSSHELEQVFFILIQNAIDWADAERRQALTISCQVEGKKIELEFSDNCGGIEPEKIQYLFEPFFVSQAGDKVTGLNLAIAKQIVSTHNGKICAESEPGLGTTIIVTLPVEQVR
jgi:signal transduction histidine kinase